MEPTSACVLVHHPKTGLVLVERRMNGACGLPGGRREERDASSLACAARELNEETGAVLRSAVSILVYEAGPHICEAFLAVDVDNLPEDPEVLRRRWATWVDAEVLVDQRRGRFPEYCARMFAKLSQMQRRGWPSEVVRCP
jgi:8-oxo-dGTP pyrophosphatase MutT (NUDIX family)